MPDTRNGAKSCNTATEQRKPPGVPFTKGDPRINRNGRPRTFDALRDIALDIANEKDKARRIMQQWADSPDIQKQKAFIEYAFGKVPDKLETTGLENKPVLVLHYAHERQEASRN